MSHIVIHDDQTNETQYAQFTDAQSAAAYLEDLHNSDGGSNARLFALEEIHFEVKSYVKVEIGDAAPVEAAAPDVATPESADPSEQLPDAVPDVFTDATVYEDTSSEDSIEALPVTEIATPHMNSDETDTVEYVEAAMAPVDVFAPSDANEPRRGLFGR